MVFEDILSFAGIRSKLEKSKDDLYSFIGTSVLIPREEEKARQGGGFKWITLEKHMVSIAALKKVLARSAAEEKRTGDDKKVIEIEESIHCILNRLWHPDVEIDHFSIPSSILLSTDKLIRMVSEPNNFIWHFDGAPPHWHLSVRDWLNITVPPYQWNGREEPPYEACMAWPPYSPYLILCDFYLWGFIKDCVFVPLLPDDRSELRHRIEAAMAKISSDTMKKVWDEFAYRIDLCRVTNGAHIEYL
ncbi:uncharacterized protein TNCV_774921 [Trichonephila clavipes]|nr:uncharacterized protein TNCV_774921 [Trichonephila clavipes]